MVVLDSFPSLLLLLLSLSVSESASGIDGGRRPVPESVDRRDEEGLVVL